MNLNQLYYNNLKKDTSKIEKSNINSLSINYDKTLEWFINIGKKFDQNNEDLFVETKISVLKNNLENGWKYNCIELIGYTDWKYNPDLKLDINDEEVIDVITKSSNIRYYFTKNKDLLNTFIQLDIIYDTKYPSLIGFNLIKKIGYKVNLYFEEEKLYNCNIM